MKAFSELTSASQVNNEDLMAISQTSGSGYASKKTTVKDITDKSNLNLAEEYDSTSTYAVDDYVIYESVLYKCIASTTGTFDSTKWTSVVVTDEMGSGGGGGTGGHTIIDENGNSMTARAGLQFVGGANVSDDAINNKTIVDLASAGGIDGVFIDTGNVIKDDFTFDGNEHTWTATDDCILSGYIDPISSSSSAYISMGNVDLFIGYDTHNALFIPIKKGQTILYKAKSGSSMKAYGIQTGTTHSKFQPVIYSTEEREIGVWTDGKPLYEKTIDFGAIPNSTSKSVAHNISNLDKVVSFDGVMISSDSFETVPSGENSNFRLTANDTNVNVVTSANWNDWSSSFITLRYTKSTDVAGSGTWTPQGVPTHHYSTDEHIIGTWIDGKTLYEKTVSFGSISQGQSKEVNHGISNFGALINMFGACYNTSDLAWTIFQIVDDADTYIRKVNVNATRIKVYSGSHSQALSDAYITIQYTKSSS